MTADQQILQELNGLSPLVAGIPRELPYTVPAGYFDALPQLLVDRVKQTGTDPAGELAAISPLLAGIPKKTPYSVPEGFFNQVADEASAGLSGIMQANDILDEVPGPLLASLRGINPYNVPENYFESFPDSVLHKVRNSGRVIAIQKNWLRFMVAAAVVGLVALLSWLYRNNEGASTGNGLARQTEKAINELSDETILEFADPTQAIYFGNTAGNELNATDMHYLFEDVSDEALQQYLAEQPGKSNSMNN